MHGIKIPVGNFDTVSMKFYYEVAKELLKKMDVNLKITKHGINATKPEDRYFLIDIIK